MQEYAGVQELQNGEQSQSSVQILLVRNNGSIDKSDYRIEPYSVTPELLQLLNSCYEL
jgi:hypothetical protein